MIGNIFSVFNRDDVTENLFPPEFIKKEKPKAELISELLELKERIENSIKYIGDDNFDIQIKPYLKTRIYTGIYGSFLLPDKSREVLRISLEEELLYIKTLLSDIEYPEEFREKAYVILGYKNVKNGEFIKATF